MLICWHSKRLLYVYVVYQVKFSLSLVAIMPKVTSYMQSHIKSLYNQGSRLVEIFKELTTEGLKALQALPEL